MRRAGYHVIPLPKQDDTFEVRISILKKLRDTPATQIARELNERNKHQMHVPPPDYGRTRKRGGLKQLTSGLWHATTIAKIGRDAINGNLISYGARSMGDRQRLGPDGPRELEEHDYRLDKPSKPKVIQNPESQRIQAKGKFEPLLPVAELQELRRVLDERGGTQRGKPRSRTPERNPLGSRIFDMDCSWPMYRSPYGQGFRYVCAAYMQSHGTRCHHNHIDGPTAVRFVLACLQQRLFFPKRLERLRSRLEAIAHRELGDDRQEQQRLSKCAELKQVEINLDRAGKNLALAGNPQQFKRISQVFDELTALRERLEEERRAIELASARSLDINFEVESAMALANSFAGIISAAGDLVAVRKLFQTTNVRLFVRFGEEKRGKRKLRKLTSGILAVGSEPAPIQPYVGPTDRAAVKDSPNAVLESNVYGPGTEGNSLGNLNRGDRI